jgi:hypothetical protein
MEVRGYPRDTTWEQIGLHRLTVARFERVMRRTSLLEPICTEYRSNRWVAPLKRIPCLREFFIGEVLAVCRKMTPPDGGRSE